MLILDKRAKSKVVSFLKSKPRNETFDPCFEALLGLELVNVRDFDQKKGHKMTIMPPCERDLFHCPNSKQQREMEQAERRGSGMAGLLRPTQSPPSVVAGNDEDIHGDLMSGR